MKFGYLDLFLAVVLFNVHEALSLPHVFLHSDRLLLLNDIDLVLLLIPVLFHSHHSFTLPAQVHCPILSLSVLHNDTSLTRFHIVKD